jgi:hypothetical protein
MARKLVKLANLVVLILTVLWLSKDPGWDSLVAMATAFVVLLGLEVTDRSEPNKSETVGGPDQELFLEFLNIMPSDGAIRFLRKQEMGGHFNRRGLDDLYAFVGTWEDVTHEFQDSKLEAKRKQLLQQVNDYCDLIGLYTEQDHGDSHHIRPYLRHEQPDEFQKAVRELHKQADKIVKLYDEFIRLGRKKLRV